MSVEFHSLPVEVRAETDDSICLSFDVPEELREDFRHVPGQHLVLRAMIDGQDVRRSYSICSSASEEALRVGIKRIPNGVFSTFATSTLRTGDVLDVMTPIGEFGYTPDPANTSEIVALAAGSGITPILSILTTALEQEPNTRCTLVYGNRTSTTIMFIEEIEALKNRFPDRFQVVHIISREPHEIPLFEGRIDESKLRSLCSSLIDVSSIDHWFLCGPLDMVETAETTLAELGVASDAINTELFFDERIESIPDQPSSNEDLVRLEMTIDGRTSVVYVDPKGPSLLDYARSVRAEVPFACKGGMCATCKAQVIEGDVRLDKNYALTSEELDAGYVLTCQSHPVGGEVHITFDVHGGVGR
jgi:ring-1,2-phenylacetyl-CoA epoxidase subunit PaaE